MDFDNAKVYGDTSIADGLVLISISSSHLVGNHKAPGWDSSPPVEALPGLSCGPGGLMKTSVMMMRERR